MPVGGVARDSASQVLQRCCDLLGLQTSKRCTEDPLEKGVTRTYCKVYYWGMFVSAGLLVGRVLCTESWWLLLPL